MAPKPQCKSSGPKSLKSKRQTQPLEGKLSRSPLTFPCQILIGQVAYLSLSACLNPPSGRYFSFSFSLFFFSLSLFFAVYFGEPGRSSRFPQSGSHGYRRGDSVKDGG